MCDCERVTMAPDHLRLHDLNQYFIFLWLLQLFFPPCQSVPDYTRPRSPEKEEKIAIEMLTESTVNVRKPDVQNPDKLFKADTIKLDPFECCFHIKSSKLAARLVDIRTSKSRFQTTV